MTHIYLVGSDIDEIFMQVVPDGFGVAYITSFDGMLKFSWWMHVWSGWTDYLQFTITSRVEMPNEEFAAEISRAAADTFTLYFPGETVPKPRLWYQNKTKNSSSGGFLLEAKSYYQLRGFFFGGIRRKPGPKEKILLLFRYSFFWELELNVMLPTGGISGS
jgi:hypothetical protein